jgi:hypothetical protein
MFASAEVRSRIIGGSITFSGGLIRVICATGAWNARATRGVVLFVFIALFISLYQSSHEKI